MSQTSARRSRLRRQAVPSSHDIPGSVAARAEPAGCGLVWSQSPPPEYRRPPLSVCVRCLLLYLLDRLMDVRVVCMCIVLLGAALGAMILVIGPYSSLGPSETELRACVVMLYTVRWRVRRRVETGDWALGSTGGKGRSEDGTCASMSRESRPIDDEDSRLARLSTYLIRLYIILHARPIRGAGAEAGTALRAPEGTEGEGARLDAAYRTTTYDVHTARIMCAPGMS